MAVQQYAFSGGTDRLTYPGSAPVYFTFRAISVDAASDPSTINLNLTITDTTKTSTTTSLGLGTKTSVENQTSALWTFNYVPLVPGRYTWQASMGTGQPQLYGEFQVILGTY